MPNARTARVFGLLAALVVSSPALRATAAEVDRGKLRSQYENKQMMLRNFYCGQALKFDEHGTLLSGGQPGPWTLCRDIRIKKIKLHDGRLEITGRRVPLFYDSHEKRFRDMFQIVHKDRRGYETLEAAERLSIEVRLPANANDQALAAAMDTLFYSSEEQFVDTAPDFWKPLLRRLYGSEAPPAAASGPGAANQNVKDANSAGQPSPFDSGEKVLRAGKEVRAPVPVYAPDPDFTAEARYAAYQGTMAMTLIVGPDGQVSHLRLTRCLGLGLDEKAEDKVLTWRFKPSRKDGEPVSVEVSVEVQFNLY